MLDQLKQFFLNKTVLTQPISAAVGFLAAWLASKGFTLTPDQQAQLTQWLVGGALVVGNILCEHLTGPGIATPTKDTHFFAPPILPMAKKVLPLVFLIGLTVPALAQHNVMPPPMPHPKPIVTPAPSPSPKSAADILRKGIAANIDLGTKVIADANFANKIATASGLTLDQTCTAAISTFATNQVALLQSLPTDIPDPAPITYFVVGRVLGKTVKNGLPLEIHVGCDPVVIDTGKDINSAMLKIVGAGGLAFLTGGIIPPGILP
jgi:hypothetical protein